MPGRAARLSGRLWALATEPIHSWAWTTGWIVVVAAVTLQYAVLTPPSAGATLGNPTAWLDYSWIRGLVLAHAQGLHWGTDIVFAYGPLGFLANPAAPGSGTWAAALVTAVGLRVGVVTALGVILRARPLAPLIWVVAGLLVVVAGESPSPEVDGVILGFVLLLRSLDDPVLNRWRLSAAGGAVLALAALIKGNALVDAAALLVTWTVIVLVRRPRRLGIAPWVGFAVSATVLWLLAGQRPGDVVPFLRQLAQVIAGYPAAMSRNSAVAGSAGTFLLIVGAMATVAWVGAAVLAAVRRHHLAPALVLGSPIVVVAFKEAFVRPSRAGAAIFYAFLVLLTVVLFAAHVRASHDFDLRRLVQQRAVQLLAAIVASMTVGTLVLSHGAPLATIHSRMQTYSTAAHLAVSRSYRDLWRRYELFLEQAYYGLPQPMVAALRSGTADIAPWDVAVADAYGLRWQPRPVLQSYSAYTPQLDQLDAARYEGSSAPDRLLFIWQELPDGRYPLYDEPQWLRTVLMRYTVQTGPTGPYLVLRQRSVPVHDTPRAEGRACSTLGEPIPVPAVPGRFVYGSVSVSPSLLGRVMWLAYRPSLLSIRLGLRDGRETTAYRFVGDVAQDGILLAGLATSAQGLADLDRGIVTTPIASLTVDGSPSLGVSKQICVSFFSTASPAP